MQPEKVVDGTSHQGEAHLLGQAVKAGQAVKLGQVAKLGQVVNLDQADLAHNQVGQALIILDLAHKIVPDQIILRTPGPGQNHVTVPRIHWQANGKPFNIIQPSREALGKVKK